MADVRIIPHVDTPYPLGRHIEHDDESRGYAFKAARAVTPTSVRHLRHVSLWNQGDIGSCTGNASLGCIGTGGFYDTVRALPIDWTEAGAVSVYTDATVIDGIPGTYPAQDTGSTGIAVAKVLKSRGYISGYQHTFSFNDLLAALQDRPVIVGVGWYNNFFYPDSNGVITIGNADYVAGGHEFILDEIDVERQLIGATNSWGEEWGLRGRFYIPFAVMQRLLKEQGDCTVFVPLTQPAPEPAPSDPTVVPEVTTVADQALWSTVKDWSRASHTGSNKSAANAVKTWAAVKHLQ